MDDRTRPVSSRFSLPAESPLTELAERSAECDRVQFSVTESLAEYVLGRACADLGLTVNGDARSSDRFASIAECVSRTGARPDHSPDPWAGADSSTFAGGKGDASADSTRKDAGANNAVGSPRDGGLVEDESVEDLPAGSAEHPPFPGFDPDEGFSAWTHNHLAKDELTQISALLGTTKGRAKRRVSTAMTLVFGLPEFCRRVRDGEFTTAHAEVVMYACDTLAMRHLPVVDRYLKLRRADVTCETLKRTLLQEIMVIQPPEDRYKEAAQRRRVDIDNRSDGSSCLLVNGPTLEINACYQRVRAMAKAVYSNQALAFGLPPGTDIVDDRGIDTLMFDILTRSLPTLTTRVTVVDPVTGVPRTHDEPFDADSCTTSTAGTDGHVTHCFASPGGNAEAEVLSSELVLTLPTNDWWISRQGGLIATVPFMTAYGKSQLPGQLPDGSPIPAETARRLVGNCGSLLRVLTDPASGTPLDSKALTYRIPRSVRTTVTSQWMLCSTPGCTRQAVHSEIDHVEPFNHANPELGGTTSFGNLHPLCRQCHALKTAGTFSVRMPESGRVEFAFAQGLQTTVFAPDSPIDAAQALRLWEIGQKCATFEWTLPPPGNGPADHSDNHPSTAVEPSEQSGVTNAAAPVSGAIRRIAERAAENYLALYGPTYSADCYRFSSVRQYRWKSARQRDDSASEGTTLSGAAFRDPVRQCQAPTSRVPDICVRRRTTRTIRHGDVFDAPVVGAEIVEHDPLILMAAKGYRTDGSPLFSAFARNRREQLLSHSGDDELSPDSTEGRAGRIQDRRRNTSGRSYIDWDHKFDDDPPPF